MGGVVGWEGCCYLINFGQGGPLGGGDIWAGTWWQRERASHADIWEESFSGRGSGRCKGPEVGVSLASSGSRREASVAASSVGEEDRGAGAGEGCQVRL